MSLPWRKPHNRELGFQERPFDVAEFGDRPVPMSVAELVGEDRTAAEDALMRKRDVRDEPAREHEREGVLVAAGVLQELDARLRRRGTAWRAAAALASITTVVTIATTAVTELRAAAAVAAGLSIGVAGAIHWATRRVEARAKEAVDAVDREQGEVSARR